MDRFPIQVRWIIWGALSFSILVYIAVSLVSKGPDQPDPKVAGLKPIFYGVGFFFILLSQAVKYFVNHLKTPEGDSRIPSWIDQAFIAALAFAELPAILALVLGLSGASLTEALPLFAIAAVGMVMITPNAFYRAELRQASGGAES